MYFFSTALLLHGESSRLYGGRHGMARCGETR
jgi:hypothetical protein